MISAVRAGLIAPHGALSTQSIVLGAPAVAHGYAAAAPAYSYAAAPAYGYAAAPAYGRATYGLGLGMLDMNRYLFYIFIRRSYDSSTV